MSAIDNRTVLYATLVASAAGLALVGGGLLGSDRRRHPPSPKSYPLIGNLLSVPSGLEHEGYMKLGQQLKSDIIYLEIFGQRIIVLNSAEDSYELLEKRSAIYSDRFCPTFTKDPNLFDQTRNPGLLGYNDLWRHHRRMMNKWLNIRAVTQFDQLLEHQSHLLLHRMLNKSTQPQAFEVVEHEFLFTMASTMLRLAYGYRLQNEDDVMFTQAQLTVDRTMDSVMFTNFYVNIFPSLARIPDWVPGTGWKRTAREWRMNRQEALRTPYEWTKSQMKTGTAEPSVLKYMLEGDESVAELSPEERDHRLQELGMALYAAGTDTTATALVKFVAAMVINPDAQIKAQQEIDTVLGPLTLPTMADHGRLPYIHNLCLEVLRWHTAAPTGVPHVCTQDDTYKGYDIEKGTIIMSNSWAMSRNSDIYKDPDAFNPDRFLDPDVPPLPGFGWGRRKCPGIHFAESALFIMVSSLLASFTFTKKLDDEGKEIIPKIEGATNSLTFSIKPFEFDFKPRSEQHRQLIRDLAIS
ncbi:unnamed protein product [Rhizoctonia solani]|nr:unnamed protein product [Rhizoctonia solani]